ncbi:MAG TPA: AAA family ATPase [Pyrinomonadaceae bacterium]|jgi:predicted kinase|nr:AAA family ATPase [Pyrinomonadaceae bacterium]
MEAVIFIGIQGTGKSSFYQERFFQTHIRISSDMLKTKHRLRLLFNACLDAKQSFVLDNTNVTKELRADFIAQSRAAGFRVVGYYFRSDIASALTRNSQRVNSARIPDVGVLGTYKKLEIPQPSEGFDALYYVRIEPEGKFQVEEWSNEV